MSAIQKRNRRQFCENAHRRSDVYGLISSIFSQEPDESFIKYLLKDKSLRLLLAERGKREEEFWAQSPQKICEDLAVEYTRLFLGPKGHIPPFESLYNYEEGENRQIWGSATVDVKRIIESAGLSFRNDSGGIPDHIGIEFEFMQKLVGKEAELWDRKKDDSQLLKTVQLEKKFIDRHLEKWIPDFCQKVVKKAKLDFYKNIAKLTQDFIDCEKKEVKNLLSFFTG